MNKLRLLLPTYAAAFNILGCCYRFSPNQHEFERAQAFFKSENSIGEWPVKNKARLSELFKDLSTVDYDKLRDEWLRLFVGPQALPAPPWGSVYLDPENVLRGCSTIKLRKFLQQENLQVNTDSPEPEDHIGLLLFLAAVLADEDLPTTLNTLLNEHVLTWLPLYIEQLKQAQAANFYCALAELTLLTINELVKIFHCDLV